MIIGLWRLGYMGFKWIEKQYRKQIQNQKDKKRRGNSRAVYQSKKKKKANRRKIAKISCLNSSEALKSVHSYKMHDLPFFFLPSHTRTERVSHQRHQHTDLASASL